MKARIPLACALAASVLVTASCGSYYEEPPPYYQPPYGPAYQQGWGGQGPDSRKIENPDWDSQRQFGANPAPGNVNPGAGSTQPGPGGGTAPIAPAGPPNGILVPNRPGMIMSPYVQDPNKLIDVSGLPSGTVIQCPYAGDGRTIRVP